MTTPVHQLLNLAGETALVAGGSKQVRYVSASAMAEAGAEVVLIQVRGPTRTASPRQTRLYLRRATLTALTGRPGYQEQDRASRSQSYNLLNRVIVASVRY